MTEKSFLSCAETADELGCSVWSVYRMLDAGELPSVTFRRRRFVPRRAIDAVLEAAMQDFDPNSLARRQQTAGAGGFPPDGTSGESSPGPALHAAAH